MSLKEYHRKRDFSRTAEPSGKEGKRAAKAKRHFVIQKHAATRLHFDFRLELSGTLVSWAVPKGLPMKKGEKRLAVKVEDHPLSYADFEGTIPKGEYGGGTVQVWDTGTFEPLTRAPLKELEQGKLHLTLKGKKLHGEWYLVRLRDEEQWLIIRGGEDHPAIPEAEATRSAISGRTMSEIATGSAPKPGATRKKSIRQTPASKPKALVTGQPAFDDAAFIEPMKAITKETAPEGEWSYEVKFDGFRIGAYKQGKAVHLISRNCHELTERFAEVAEALQSLKARDCVVDGEVVALDEKGRSSFQLLQAQELGEESPPLCFYAFDLLQMNGKSLMAEPLEQRKKKLQSILPEGSDLIRFSHSLGSDSRSLLKKVGELGLEGLIGKRVASPYESGQRSGKWIKLKLVKQQEFVIGGYTPPSGTRQHFGALLVGVYEEGKFICAGKVGTGFTEAVLKDLQKHMAKISRKTCPFTNLPDKSEGRYGQGITPTIMKKCHWVQPSLVCQLKFTEWTRDGRLRHPVYLGLRKDKPAKQVVREFAH